jgi:2-keto-4-pentenoate hydratase/2-oxohepta-3-ene-1,7-dioic acid hydratase in catechol pathway
MSYRHRSNTGQELALPVGKVICVGRNYAEHALELNNPVPTEPILFIKPSTAVVDMRQPIGIPTEQGSCHVETEIALLIDTKLCRATERQAAEAIAGLGLGFDLTLRDVQNELKKNGLPWEMAKAFDGSCPLSGFLPVTRPEWDNIGLQLQLNGETQQYGNSIDMITPIVSLLVYISHHFTLLPGDVVLTGTPAGVCPLNIGDELIARVVDPVSELELAVETEIVSISDR